MGTIEIKPPRLAASVLLVRDTRHGLEVLLQQRDPAMPFAPDVAAFPGGGLAPEDDERPSRWRGPDPTWWASRFRCTERLAVALVCAAVRETFEECGILLGGPEGRLARSEDGLSLLRRQCVDRRDFSIKALLDARGWALHSDSLRPWAHWITPASRPKRYDTRFFIARCPGEQEADPTSSEVTSAAWWRPDDALAAARNGALNLMLPTRACLENLLGLRDVATALEFGASRAINAVVPVITFRDGVEMVSVPS